MPEEPSRSEWSVVEFVATVEEAELLTGFLRNEGIPSRIESTHSNEFPLNVGELAEIRVEVPPDKAAEAQRLLEDLERANRSRSEEGSE